MSEARGKSKTRKDSRSDTPRRNDADFGKNIDLSDGDAVVEENHTAKADSPRSESPKTNSPKKSKDAKAPVKAKNKPSSGKPNSQSANPPSEPLSLAEEIADEGGSSRPSKKKTPVASDVHLADLQRMDMQELLAVAKAENVPEVSGLKKQDLIFKILKERVKMNGLMFGEGTLEILPDGFGFLRSPDYHYISCPDDIYVSPSQIRRFGLKTGSTVAGQIRPPKESERYFALLRVEAINYQDPNSMSEIVDFDDLTPLHPKQRISMESTAEELDTLSLIHISEPRDKRQSRMPSSA